MIGKLFKGCLHIYSLPLQKCFLMDQALTKSNFFGRLGFVLDHWPPASETVVAIKTSLTLGLIHQYLPKFVLKCVLEKGPKKKSTSDS